MNSESSIMESHVSNSPGLDEYQIFIDGLRDGLFICSGSEMLACNKQLRSTSKGLAFLDDLKLRYKDLIHIYSYDIEPNKLATW